MSREDAPRFVPNLPLDNEIKNEPSLPTKLTPPLPSDTENKKNLPTTAPSNGDPPSEPNPPSSNTDSKRDFPSPRPSSNTESKRDLLTKPNPPSTSSPPSNTESKRDTPSKPNPPSSNTDNKRDALSKLSSPTNKRDTPSQPNPPSSNTDSKKDTSSKSSTNTENKEDSPSKPNPPSNTEKKKDPPSKSNPENKRDPSSHIESRLSKPDSTLSNTEKKDPPRSNSSNMGSRRDSPPKSKPPPSLDAASKDPPSKPNASLPPGANGVVSAGVSGGHEMAVKPINSPPGSKPVEGREVSVKDINPQDSGADKRCVCMDWLKGRCTMDPSTCRYLHDLNARRPPCRYSRTCHWSCYYAHKVGNWKNQGYLVG